MAARQPFRVCNEFVVRKQPFRFHGRSYKHGDHFPWRRVGCSVRTLRKLYNAGHLSLPEVDINELPDDPELPVIEPPTPEEETSITTYDPEIHEITITDDEQWVIADKETGDVLLEVDEDVAAALADETEPVELAVEDDDSEE